MNFIINDKPEKDFLPMQKITEYLDKLPNGKMLDGKRLRAILNLRYNDWSWFRDNQKYSKYLYKEAQGKKILCGNIQTIKAYTEYRRNHE